MSLRTELSEDQFDLIQLYEGDLKRHEEAINEHNRTLFTVRGFAVTAVAALIAATYASHAWEPALGALFAAVFFAVVDYNYARLYSEIAGRRNVLESLAQSYRKLMRVPSRTAHRERQLEDFKADLRSYLPGSVNPSSPELWESIRGNRRELQKERKEGVRWRSAAAKFLGRQTPDSFRSFALFYAFMILVALVSALTVGSEPKRISTVRVVRITAEAAGGASQAAPRSDEVP